ncbi:unnamed protein product [Durusdinium trenchii]
MDANAFNAAVRSDGSPLPELSTLTYQGVFNQHSYQTGGPEEVHKLAVSAYASRFEEEGSAGLWLACFLKSSRDGQPRDEVPMDLIVVLDVSGSMNWPVDGALRSGGVPRLALAKDALMALLPKLRPDDRFGLATFSNEGRVIQPLTFVSILQQDELQERIVALQAGGGTTISAGLEAAVQISGETDIKERHRRLLFLTDMDDMRPGQLDNMVAKQSERGLYVSFVGIGQNFKAELAEQVSKHRGSNYFCITRDEEMRKTIVDNFDWNFFPVAFDVEVTQQSDSFQLASVYGTPFDARDELVEAEWMPDVHRFYPLDFKSTVSTFLLCIQRQFPAGLPMPALQGIFSFLSSGVRSVIRVDTVFPSGVHADGAVDGGLILLRLRGGSGQVRLTLRYQAGERCFTTCQDVVVPDDESVPEAIRKGVILQRYVQTCREYLMLREPVCKDCDGFEDYATRVRCAFQNLDVLGQEFANDAANVDALCPGLRDQLHAFQEMAEKHAKRVLDSK